MSVVEYFLDVLVAVIGFAALSWFIYRLASHIKSYNMAAGRITFKQFRTLYEINDDPWILKDDGVNYWADNVGYICLCFSFLDEIRYMTWRKRKEHLKEKNKKNKCFQIALAGMQKDLEEYKEKLENN